MYVKKCVFKCLSDNLFSLLIISPTSVYLAMIVRSDFQDFLVGGVTSDFRCILTNSEYCAILHSALSSSHLFCFGLVLFFGFLIQTLLYFE